MKRPPAHPQSADEELLRRFETFYRLHYPKVSRFVARRLPPESHEEVVAAAFVIAWKKFSDVDSPSLPWLYRIANFEISHERRRLGRTQQLLAPWDVISASKLALEDVIDVSSAFSQLSEADQEVLRLLYWEDLDRREIATVLGCSINALNVRVHRALDRLRGAMSREAAASHRFESYPNDMKDQT